MHWALDRGIAYQLGSVGYPPLKENPTPVSQGKEGVHNFVSVFVSEGNRIWASPSHPISPKKDEDGVTSTKYYFSALAAFSTLATARRDTPITVVSAKRQGI